ncbi:PepSY-associated TM helix domain-containing protein [Paraburkholderia sp. BCC1885]|uniref:PepSY-associated TM helix domain-containing protein n=1 Tax=Paraburkholderia sp. BCC1885 TaxID=2562669 RepID=UPI001183E153|nr:PepSY domain-containing protein [Paraburkholderia sp. BCC1885]
MEPLLYRHRMVVEPQAQPRLNEDALLARARLAMPEGSMATTATISRDPARSAEFVFRLPDGEKTSVYLNPYTGKVLGTLSVEHRFMQVDRMLHRKLLLGKPGELLMELAACWTLVMIGTGIALWWPREMALRSALRPDFALKGRALWKSVHAVLGIWLALGALAFVLSGLPWSGSWGRQFKALATSANLGAPPGAWGGSSWHSRVPAGAAKPQPAKTGHQEATMESMPGMVMDDLPLPTKPWATGDMPVARSQSDATQARFALGRVVDLAASLGVTNGYDIVMPASATGVYTVSYYPPDPKQERTIFIDQYSGAVLKDIRYSDYGAVSKAVSYGTSLHMGRYFGPANQIVCALISLGLAAMALTGCVMWWKRRAKGSLGAPGRERFAPPMRAWKTGLILLGILFPLMGVSMLLVWIADRTVFGRASQNTNS